MRKSKKIADFKKEFSFGNSEALPTVSKYYTILQNIRWRWFEVSLSRTDNFRKAQLTPTNYISLEREFNGE